MKERVKLVRERVRLQDPLWQARETFAESIADGVIRIEPPSPGAQSNYHVPTPYTRRQVELMTAYRLRHDEIAHIIGISENTMRSHYKDELAHGLAKVNALVAHRALDIALRGEGKEAVSMIMFWLKTRAGFVESIDVNHNGRVAHEHYALTNEERAARMLQVINAGATGGTGRLVAERLRTMVAAAGATDASVLQSSG